MVINVGLIYSRPGSEWAVCRVVQCVLWIVFTLSVGLVIALTDRASMPLCRHAHGATAHGIRLSPSPHARLQHMVDGNRLTNVRRVSLQSTDLPGAPLSAIQTTAALVLLSPDLGL